VPRSDPFAIITRISLYNYELVYSAILAKGAIKSPQRGVGLPYANRSKALHFRQIIPSFLLYTLTLYAH